MLIDKDCIVDKDDGLIKWDYIVQLHYLQECEGIHLANKLQKSHIQWTTQKVKIKLSVQIFSALVADAIDFCKNIGLKDFFGTELLLILYEL